MPWQPISRVRQMWGDTSVPKWNTPVSSSDLGAATSTFAVPDIQYPSFDYGSWTAEGRENLTGLTEYINELNRTAQTLSNQARIPGAAGLEQQSSTNIGAALRGEVPEDVVRLLQQQAAERGVSVGPESPNVNAAYLRALGLTSLGQMQTGQEDLTRAYARNPAAPLFDPTSQLLTPYQVAQLDLQREQLQAQSALQQQQLALQRAALAARGSGGGGGGTTRYTSPLASTASQVNPMTRTYGGATGNILAGSVAPEFGQQDWWGSIGYSPTTTGSTGGGTFYAGESYGGLTPDELYYSTGITPDLYTDLGLEGMDLFP